MGFRGHAVTDYAYVEGEQWSAAELAKLAKRGQPPTQDNQLKVTVDRILGGYLANRTRITYRPRSGDPERDLTANVLDDVFIYIAQNTKLKYEERDCVAHGTKTGFGVLYVSVEFDALLQPRIRIRCVPSLECFPDPDSRRYDWNEDAEHISWAKWWAFEEAKARYPRRAKDIDHLQHDATYAGQLAGVEQFRNTNYLSLDKDGNPTRLRVVEQWYKTYTQEQLVIVTPGAAGLPDKFDGHLVTGEMRDLWQAEGRHVRDLERTKVTMHEVVYCGGIELAHRMDPHHSERFPFVPYFVDRRENGEPYSRVRIGRPLQDEINKRRSKAVHLLSTNRAIYEQGAINDKTALASEMARPDAQIEINRGKFERFRLETNLELAASQFAMHQEAVQSLRLVTGVNPDARGEKSELRSGIAIAKKLEATETVLSPDYDNYLRTRGILALVVLDFVKEYFTTETILYITKDDRKSKAVPFDANVIQTLQSTLYDVEVDAAPDTATKQQEQMQLIAPIIAQLPLGDPRTALLVKMSDLRDKESLLEEIAKASQAPPPLPRISLAINWEALTPAEKQAFALIMGSEPLIDAEEADPHPPTARVRQQTELAKHAGQNQTQLAAEEIRGQVALRKEGMRLAAEAAQRALDRESANNGTGESDGEA